MKSQEDTRNHDQQAFAARERKDFLAPSCERKRQQHRSRKNGSPDSDSPERNPLRASRSTDVRGAVAGVMLRTGHSGNWGVGGAACAAGGGPLDAVARGMANDSVHAGVSEVRRRLGFGLIDMNGAHRAGMRSLGKGREIGRAHV